MQPRFKKDRYQTNDERGTGYPAKFTEWLLTWEEE